MMPDTAMTDDDFKGVCCPHCQSANLCLISLFGSSVSEVMFRCLSCRTFFNWIKWQGRMPPSPALENENKNASTEVAGPRASRQ